MQITEIIRKKRDGESLSEAELNFFVDGFTGGKIPDYQASALLMEFLSTGFRWMRPSGCSRPC